jgi:hypothetical protein
MPPHQTLPAARLRALLLAMTSGCLLIASGAGARAADGDGLDFFRQIFSGPASNPAPVAQPYVVQPYDAPVRQRLTRRNRLPAHARAALRGKTRYVALPKAEAKPEKADTKPLALAVSPLKSLDARTALLRDPTLRPGDIVIMPEGPRVFRGDPDTDKHRMADFQDVTRGGEQDPQGAARDDGSDRGAPGRRRTPDDGAVPEGRAGGAARGPDRGGADPGRLPGALIPSPPACGNEGVTDGGRGRAGLGRAC